MNKRKIIVLCSVFVMIGVLATIIVVNTYSRYTSSNVWNYYLKSKNFYFESKELSTEGIKHSDTIWNGEKVEFSLSNALSVDKISDSDINYKVSCKVVGDENLKCKINGEDEFSGTLSSYKTCENTTGDGVDTSSYTKSKCELEGYTYKTSETKKDLYFEVVSNNPDYKISKVEVLVTAISTSPYKKTLTGSYILNKETTGEGSIEKKYNSYDDYSRLIISNYYDETKCLIVNWDSSTKILDLQSSEEDLSSLDSEYVNGMNITIPAKSNSSFIFYDTGTPVDDFELHILDFCNE